MWTYLKLQNCTPKMVAMVNFRLYLFQLKKKLTERMNEGILSTIFITHQRFYFIPMDYSFIREFLAPHLIDGATGTQRA